MPTGVVNTGCTLCQVFLWLDCMFCWTPAQMMLSDFMYGCILSSLYTINHKLYLTSLFLFLSQLTYVCGLINKFYAPNFEKVGVDIASACVYQNKIRVLKFHIYTRVIFYVRRIGLYLYKYRIYGTISIYILKGLAPVYHLIYILHH